MWMGGVGDQPAGSGRAFSLRTMDRDQNRGDEGLRTTTRIGMNERIATRARKLHILVEDEGPGLGDTGNLFVPFFTTKQGGSGIGLVLSRQIAEGHGGTLELENRAQGRGARARIILPLDPMS